jgi:hypothetical protein
MVPFTSEQFLAVFVSYNTAVWPTQIAAYLLGGVAVALVFLKPREGDRIIAGILALMWLWTGFGAITDFGSQPSIKLHTCLLRYSFSKAALFSMRASIVVKFASAYEPTWRPEWAPRS